MSRHIEQVEDYTNAFLVTAGVTLFMAFLTLAAIKGMVWVFLTAALLDGAIRVKAARRRAGQIGEHR